MNDGPFREAQQMPERPRLSRGGQLAGENAFQDPYFKPPIRPIQPNPVQPPEQGPLKPNLPAQPIDRGPNVQPPPEQPKAPAVNAPVAPLSRQSGPFSDLAKLLEDKEKGLGKAKERQTGAPLANAFIGGTAALVTEPANMGLTKLADRALRTTDSSTLSRSMRGVAGYWSANFNPNAIKAADEGVMSSTYTKIDEIFQLDKRVLDKLLIKKTNLLPKEEAHLASLRTGLGVSKNSVMRQILTNRVSLLHPERIGGMNAEQLGGVIGELAKGRLVNDAEFQLLTRGTEALKSGDKELISSTFRKIEEMCELDSKVLTKLLRQKKAILLPAEEAHLASLKTGLGVLENAEIEKLLTNRQLLLKPDRLVGMNAEQLGVLVKQLETIRLSKGTIVTDAEFQTLLLRKKALESFAESSKLCATGEGWLTARGAGRNFTTALASTFGTGVVLAADERARDYFYEGKTKSWSSSSLSVPLGIAVGKTLKSKSALAILAAGSGHLLDRQITAPDWVPDSLRTFSAFDAVPLGIAFAMPARGKVARSVLVGTAWMAGNAIESAFSPPSAGKMEEVAQSFAKTDAAQRSDTSVDAAVAKFRELGAKNEIVLEQNFAQILVNSQKKYGQMSREEKLLDHRQFIIVGRALAEHRLENGSRLAATQTDKPTYILKGHNLDIGGDALSFFLITKRSVEGSKTLTKMLMGSNVSGSTVTEAELQALDSQGGKIDECIAKINGKHDIAGAFSGMEAFLKRGSTSSSASFIPLPIFHKTMIEEINVKLGRWTPGLRNSDGTANEEAKMMVAKLFRDQALAKMALCSYKLDDSNVQDAASHLLGTAQGRDEPLPGSQIRKGYDGALDMLACAEALCPNNQDLPELKAIAKQLTERLKGASK